MVDYRAQNKDKSNFGSERTSVGDCSSETGPTPSGRHGVVAVLIESGRFLAIRRSEFVRAPRMVCFPGGGIEPNEDFSTAIRREMREELELEVEVIEHVWSSRTAWGTALEWLLVKRVGENAPIMNPQEVAEILWLTQDELLAHPDLLGSLSDFFGALNVCKTLEVCKTALGESTLAKGPDAESRPDTESRMGNSKRSGQ